MTAGLPGAGIAGLYFVICALVMPLVEVYRLLRGRSNPAGRRLAAYQASIALTTVTTIGFVYWTIGVMIRSPAGHGHGHGHAHGHASLLWLGVSVTLLMAVLGIAGILGSRFAPTRG